MKITIINPDNLSPFPSAMSGGRQCFAVPEGSRFAVEVSELGYSRREVVLAVDGRDTLSNADASQALNGIIVSDGTYVCKGFRVSQQAVREFVCVALGDGLTTAERNGTTTSAGLVAAAVFREKNARAIHYESAGITRGGTRGMSLSRGVGAAAGDEVRSHVGETQWTRGPGLPETAVVEYDTMEGWRARGVVIPMLKTLSPWPADDAQSRFSDPAKL